MGGGVCALKSALSVCFTAGYQVGMDKISWEWLGCDLISVKYNNKKSHLETTEAQSQTPILAQSPASLLFLSFVQKLLEDFDNQFQKVIYSW